MYVLTIRVLPLNDKESTMAIDSNISRRSFMAAAAGTLAAAGLAGTFAGTSANVAKADEPKQGGTLTVSLTSAPSKLDPIHYSGAYEGQIICAACDRLIEYNDELTEFVPSLATSWEVSDDGITYVFQIREGVTFNPSDYHDRRPLTAEDVAYSLNRSAQFSDNARLSMLDKAEATGDLEVTCTLTNACAAFLTALTDAGNSIIAQEDVEGYGDSFNRNVCGTGAFKLVEFSLDERATLEANEEYWLARPNVDTLVFRFITDLTQNANAAVTGEVDIATDLMGEAIATVQASDAVEVLTTQALQISYIRFNSRDEIEGRPNPLADVNVRKALAMAADWDAIRTALFKYDDAVPGYLPIPFGSWAYDPSQESLAPSYDIEQAMQLMADSGYASGFDISMYVTNNQARVDLATMLQAYWSVLGVNLTPVIGEWGSYSDAVCGGKADTYAMSWSWYPDPYFFLNNLFASNQTTAIGNGAGYVNAEVDDLLLKAVQTNDQDERAKYYQQVIEIAMNDCVGVYYAVPNVFYAKNPRVHDFAQRADSMLRFVTASRNTWVE